MGRADLLLDGPEPLSEAQRRSVEAILRATERLQHLLDELSEDPDG